MLAASTSAIRSRSQEFVARLEEPSGLGLSLVEGFSKVGGGAAPEEQIGTVLIAVDVKGLSAQQVQNKLRAHEPPIIARIADDRVLLDLRTVFPEQEESVLSALRTIVELVNNKQ
jgi:L-seryl-tRNA(Ser) seleniumtransferase